MFRWSKGAVITSIVSLAFTGLNLYISNSNSTELKSLKSNIHTLEGVSEEQKIVLDSLGEELNRLRLDNSRARMLSDSLQTQPDSVNGNR